MRPASMWWRLSKFASRRLRTFVSCARMALRHVGATSWVAALAVMTQGLAIGQDGHSDHPKAMFLGAWDRAVPMLERAAAERGWDVRFVSSSDIGSIVPEDFADVDVVLVLNLLPEGVPSLSETLLRVREDYPEIQVLALDHRDSQAGLLRRNLLLESDGLRAYWRNSSLENYRRMFDWLAHSVMGIPGTPAPPLTVPDHAVWHPDSPGFFTDIDSYRAWLAERGMNVDGRRVALVTQQSFLVLADTAVHAAIVRELESRGIAVAVFYSDRQEDLLAMLRKWDPQLMLDDGHASPMLLAGAQELDVPQIKVISMLRSTLDEWRESPLGLEPGDVSLHLLTQEVYGIIDPQVVGGLVANVQGYRMHEPDAERLRHLADRVEGWLDLREKEPEERRIAIVYYHKYLSKGDLLRGSPSGAFLDGPASLLRVLRALHEAGYVVDPLPSNVEELLAMLQSRGRNVGAWAEADLAQLVRTGNPVLIPVPTYQEWLRELPSEAVERVEESHGPPPGRQMAWHENRRDFLVVPRIDLGGVVLLPQPARGPENDESLLHARDVPPTHQYLATYLWLQHEADVDAVVHFGTHGSELLLPTRGAGLGPEDFGDIILGDLPSITPWVLDNVAEATLAKRRSYAVLVDHMTPPYEASGLTPELESLYRDVVQFDTLEDGIVRERYRERISEAARREDLAEAGDSLLDDAAIGEVRDVLHAIASRVAPMSLHVLGQPPPPERLAAMVSSMLGKEVSDRLGGREEAESVVRRALLQDSVHAQEQLGAEAWSRAREYQRRLLACGAEITNLLHALDGRFVPPGPGNDPVRNPSAVPTGRNMYALNPEEIPTRTAWEVGVELGRQLLAKRPGLTKVAFDLNAFETMRDYGVLEAEILWLLGVEPVWDENDLVIDVRVVPRAELEHPRVDVFLAIAGAMRDNFPSRVRLLDRAIRLAAAQDESDNHLRRGTIEQEQALRAAGFSADRAANLAPARIFGQKPGEYGTRILYLVPQSGQWEAESDVASVYLENMAYVYTDDLWGERIDGLYEVALQNVDLVLRNWASNMMSPLSNHHVYEYAGGLSMAVEAVNGSQPDLLINDVRERDPSLREFDSVMREEFHSTLLNPKWATGMKEHGYAGAGQMSELVKNAFGWEVTRSGTVGQATWDAIHDMYVEDLEGLGLREWFAQVNPGAFQEIAATLLEANRKGYWEASEETLYELARAYAESVAEHGHSAGLVAGGNQALRKVVRNLLGGPADAELVSAWEAAVQAVEAPLPGEPIQGMELVAEEVEPSQPTSTGVFGAPLSRILGVIALAIVAVGLLRRSGALR